MLLSGPNIPVIFTKSMNPLTWRLLFGIIIFTMDSNFLSVGQIPFWVIHNSKYSILDWKNNEFTLLRLSGYRRHCTHG